MTHTLIPGIHTALGWAAECACGFRTRSHWPTKLRAENRVAAHIHMSTNNPMRKTQKVRARPPISIEQAAEGFLRHLYWGVDESVPTVRGGWPL